MVGRGLLRPLAAHERVLVEGHALERALFWARVAGAAIIFFLGPPVTPSAPVLAVRALGIYFLAYALLMLLVSSRATSARAQHQAAWLGHLFDTAGFLGALILNASDPQWLVSNAAPLYVFVAVTRLGPVGGLTAAAALAITHVGLAVWRAEALGIGFDPARTLVYVSIYGLAALLTTAVDTELRALRARREMQIEVHEPLLRAHDELGQGVVVTEDGHPAYVSQGFLDLTGLTRAEAMARSDLSSLLPDSETASPSPVRQGVSERTLVRRDGQRRDVEVALRRDAGQRTTRAVAIVSDVTLRRQAFEELERKQRLDSLGSLAGGIAHDFNNLLTVVVNNAYLALETAGASAVRREIEEIREAAERGMQLTRQMLVFARGGRAPGVGHADAEREVSAVERLLRRTLGAGIALDVRRTADLPHVTCDPGQVEQILMNLVLNARDAMPAGGHIGIELDRLTVRSEGSGALAPRDHLRIVVEDDGEGMPADVAARAFEPFFTTKPKQTSTGLGLSTVEGIVRRAGGQVALSSEPGSGTRVTVLLPVASVTRSPDIEGPPEEPRRDAATILLVDDTPAVRRTTAEILRRTGYRVVEAGTPTEALAAANGEVDLVVCDIVLPERSGQELAAELRIGRPDLPVVFISGYIPAEAGGPVNDPFVAKPFSPDALLAAVRGALRARNRKRES
jgi:PAS domain S-box-containing protein